MALKLSSGDYDIVDDAIEAILSKLTDGDIDSGDALSRVRGLIEAAATDDADFMTYAKAQTDA